jgi:FdhE protein
VIQTKKAGWGKRIERAMDLAGRYPAAAEVLAFYVRVLELQHTLYNSVASQSPAAPDGRSPFRSQLDIEAALSGLRALLALVQGSGPAKLAQQAAEIARGVPEQQRQMLRDFLASPDDDGPVPGSFFARVLFQPIAEHLAETPASKLAGFAGSVCPVCDARPQVAVLRPEGDGGKHFLVCSFCLTEWGFRRILCPVCGEEDHVKLPRYSAEGVAAVRVEACDSCHRYLKGVDMTADGLAVPLVDEVATVPLDLWAADKGYTKISRNIMGF